MQGFFIHSYMHTLFGPSLPRNTYSLPLFSTLVTSRQKVLVEVFEVSNYDSGFIYFFHFYKFWPHIFGCSVVRNDALRIISCF
jgi:hypothetical protein